MNKFDYKNLTPFKWFVLENFPFIEADFGALTEWQLFCKIGKEMNKIINSENTLGTQMENVTNAFIELQNYVNNYFTNLDEEIGRVNTVINLLEEEITKVESQVDGKLEEVDTAIENIHTAIQETETELDVLRQKVANQQKVIDQLPQVTGQGTEVTLENTIEAPFTKFDIEGNSVQNGTPSPETKIPIYSAGDMGSINEYIRPKQLFNIKTVSNGYLNPNTGVVSPNSGWKVSDFIKIYKLIKITLSWVSNISYFQVNMCYYDKNKNFISGVSKQGANKYEHTFTVPENAYYCKLSYSVNVSGTLVTRDKIQLEEGTANTDYEEYKEPQTYTIPTQQPMRSIGDVRDKFVKVNGNWFERHLPYIASYNGETLPQDVYNEEGGIKYCNSKSMSTTGQFSNGASVQYVDENNWNYLPCTPEQIQQLENLPSTYKDFTIINSEDETPAYLEVSGIYDLNNLINN